MPMIGEAREKPLKWNDRCCRNCCFWKLESQILKVQTGEVVGSIGHCRRYAPKFKTRWPTTRADDICGEWDAIVE